jgi:hypothetical protein
MESQVTSFATLTSSCMKILDAYWLQSSSQVITSGDLSGRHGTN